MSRREEILADVRSTLALPTAAIETLTLLQDPSADIHDIARSIEHDPGLTANVLKLANSSFFGMAHSVGSVQQAIVRLGTAEIVQMVTSLSLAPIKERSVPGYDLMPGALWEHAIAVAVTADQIAHLRSVKPSAHTFTAGMLIDVGKLVLDQAVGAEIEPIRRLAFGQQMSFEQAERTVLGIDHAEVGAHLLEHWKVPGSLVEVVRWHHEPQNVSGNRDLVDLVHTADQLVTLCGVGCGADGLNYRVSEPSVSRFNLKHSEIEWLLAQSMDVFNELRLCLEAY